MATDKIRTRPKTGGQDPKAQIPNPILHPVILGVPEEVRGFKPRDRVRFLSRHARLALRISAQKSNMRLGELDQDENQ